MQAASLSGGPLLVRGEFSATLWPVTEESEPVDGATVRVPPPLVFMAAIALAVLLGWLWPRDPWIGGWFRHLFGGISIIGGVALIVTAMGRFRQTGQDPKPWLPSPEMITTGPYQFTRNPMYLGLTLITIGIGHVIGNGWFAITAVIALLAVQQLAVVHEEAYLERKFGDAYREYKKRVRRWL
jgi:protein-S-isoprenylcysteine O-methyltransferase Ste14